VSQRVEGGETGKRVDVDIYIKHFVLIATGMTHARYTQLLAAWKDYLSEDRKSVNSSRLGPDHDSWPAFEKKLNSFQHYKIDSELIYSSCKGVVYSHYTNTLHATTAQLKTLTCTTSLNEHRATALLIFQ
jgi:hypothetical protein